MSLITTSVKLDTDVKARLQKLAGEQRRSANWLIGEAIREFVDRAEARARFLRDGVDAWEDYQRTGKYVSEEKADVWLDRLEAGEDVDPPEAE